MQRVLVVGANPGSPLRDPSKLPRGSALYRLGEWVAAAGLRYVSLVNCFYKPGRYSVDKVDWKFLHACVMMGDHDRVVALGEFPSRVLTRLGVPHERIPHPSGLNRQINDAREVRRAIRVLRGRAA